jgi:muramoyltetrapeptide carboxypeptidase LdcA involved in peptidoglycan recycling
LLGSFKDCIDDNPENQSFAVYEVLGSYFRDLKKPVVYNLKHGHLKDNLTIPFGLTCKIYSAKGIVEIKESAVN